MAKADGIDLVERFESAREAERVELASRTEMNRAVTANTTIEASIPADERRRAAALHFAVLYLNSSQHVSVSPFAAEQIIGIAQQFEAYIREGNPQS